MISDLDSGKVRVAEKINGEWVTHQHIKKAIMLSFRIYPMGGGEGKSSGGRHPCSPTGIPSKGYRTRKKNKSSNKFIVKRRKK